MPGFRRELNGELLPTMQIHNPALHQHSKNEEVEMIEQILAEHNRLSPLRHLVRTIEGRLQVRNERIEM